MQLEIARNNPLTAKQKRFIKQLGETAMSVLYIDGSLTGKRDTIRCRGENGRSSYFMTVPEGVSSDEKLKQIKWFVKTGKDIGCAKRDGFLKARVDEEDYEIPF